MLLKCLQIYSNEGSKNFSEVLRQVVKPILILDMDAARETDR